MATAVVAMVGQGGAYAITVSDTAAAVGTGTISPGLPTTGCAVQTDITFRGTGVVVGDDGVTAPATFNFDRNSGSTCESFNSGQGSGTLGGTFSSAPGGVSYVRTGGIVQVFGSVTIFGNTHTINAVCIFGATAINPVTSFGLGCAVSVS
jgi:hypothetical protein